MTPDEIQEITNSLLEGLNSIESTESGNGLIVTLIALVPTFIILGRLFNKAFIKAIEKVLKTHTKEMKEIIEDIDGIKKEQKRLEQKVDDQHKSIVDKLRDKCA